jgi:hypothetical protein
MQYQEEVGVQEEELWCGADLCVEDFENKNGG